MTVRNLFLLPGDGIGPEAMGEVRKIIAYMNEAMNAGFVTDEGLVGGSAYDAHGAAISEDDMKKALAADAVLFATPEYNRSVPAVLKNAIDVGSRPLVKSAWRGKSAAVVSVSPGALAAFGANHHLRQSLVALDMPTLQQPEAYLGSVANLVDEEGNIINETTRQFLTKFMSTFAQWIEVQRCRP